MTDPDERWHYPRPQVAQACLDELDRGAFNVAVMFERRRRGKTEMLQRDLAPLAESGGYHVVYANLWGVELTPAAILAATLREALTRKTLGERLQAFVSRPVSSIKLSGDLLGAKGEVELNLAEGGEDQVAKHLIVVINDAVDKLARSKRKTLLLIDEAQELGRGDDNLGLVKALRTLLETYRKQIKAVMTGSSREGLQAMFARAKAPFFQSGVFIDLPEMDPGFVAHMLKVYREITTRDANLAAAMRAFDSLNKSPFYFKRLTNLAINLQQPDFNKALTVLRQRLPVEMGFPQLWMKLRPLEHGVICAIAAGHDSLFGAAARKYMVSYTGGGEPEIHEVQSAVRRLMRVGLVSKFSDGRSGYELEDDEFGVWALLVQRE